MLDLSHIAPGQQGTATLLVGEAQTAPEIGSGRVHVLATPVMINLMEAAALEAVEHLLPQGHQVRVILQRPANGCRTGEDIRHDLARSVRHALVDRGGRVGPNGNVTHRRLTDKAKAAGDPSAKQAVTRTTPEHGTTLQQSEVPGKP